MWHVFQITDDRISSDTRPHTHSKFWRMFGKCGTFDDLAQTHNITTIIRHFDADKSETRNRCLNTDIFCFQGQRQIFFQSFDTIQLCPFTRFQTILRDRRTHFIAGHMDFYLKLKQRLFDNHWLKLYLFTCEWLPFWMINELLTRRILPRTLKRFYIGMFIARIFRDNRHRACQRFRRKLGGILDLWNCTMIAEFLKKARLLFDWTHFLIWKFFDLIWKFFMPITAAFILFRQSLFLLVFTERIRKSIQHLDLFPIGITSRLSELRENLSVGNMKEEIQREKEKTKEQRQGWDFIKPTHKIIMNVEEQFFRIIIKIAPERDARNPEKEQTNASSEVKRTFAKDHMQTN